MNIQNLVKASAVVVKITQLEKGNIFKYVKEDYGSPTLRYGIVLDILNNGEKAYIQILSINKEYSSISMNYELLGEDSKINLFPAVPEDLQGEYEEIIAKLKKDNEEATEKITKNIRTIDFLQGSLTKQLGEITPVSFEIQD